MSTAETIDIPIKDDTVIKIKAPHITQYRRWNYDDSLGLYGEPIVKAFDKAGLMPLPENLAARIADASQRVQLVQGQKSSQYYFQREGKISAHWLRVRVEELSEGKRPEFLGSTIEHLFRKVFKPDDFTFDQKISLFDYFAEEVVRQADEEYARKLKNDYGVHYPIYLVSENCSLKDWREKYQGRAEAALKDWLEAHTAIRNLSGYDWQPLDFIFGEHLPTLTQLKTATLTADLKLSYDTAMEEYHDFLDAAEKGSQLGAMRANSAMLESMLIGKYKIWIYLHDTGKGAAFVGDVNYHVVEPAKEMGSIFTSAFKFLFGKS